MQSCVVTFAFCLMCLAGEALAQMVPTTAEDIGADLSIETLMSLPVNTVTGASRFSQKSTEAPASVTVVTEEEIEAQGWRSLADVFRSVRGFEVTNDRTYSYLGVRGFSRLGDFNTRLLFTLDGQRLNDPIYAGYLLDPGYGVDLGEVKRIEILRGPASSQYGNNAFFGVINIVPLSGADWAQGGRQGGVISGGVGEDGTRYGRAATGGVFGRDWEYTVSVARRRTDGEDGLTYPEFPGVTTPPGSDGEDTRSARGSLRWKNTGLSAGWSERTKNIPTAPFGTVFGDTRTSGVDELAWVRLTQAVEVNPDLRAEAALSYLQYRYDGTYAFDDTGLPPGFPPGTYTVKDQAQAGAYQAELSMIRDLGSGTLGAGADMRFSPSQVQKNYVVAPRTDFMDVESDAHSVGAFTQLDWTFSPVWSASAGMRFDYDDSVGGGLHPRGAVIWHPVKASTVKLLVGTAFRVPNAYELYYDNGGLSQKAPSELDAERIASYELVWEQFVTARLKTTLSVFDNEIEDLITPVIDPNDGLAVFTNLDSASVHGVEGEVEWLFAQGASLVASVAVQKVEQSGLPSTSAEVLGKLAARTPLPGVPLWIGGELQYAGGRQDRDGSSVADYWLLNVSVGTREYRGFSARLTFRNLGDTNYSDPVGDDFAQRTLVQPGRSVDLTASWRF